jgi:hypothetical protein
MSFQQGVLGVALVTLGAAFAFALQSIVQVGKAIDPVVAAVHGKQIRQSDVDDAAGCELQSALARIQDLRHEAREYLIGRYLIEAEALRSQRSYHRIFATEVTGRVNPVSDARVREVAATYTPGADPPPEVLITVRNQLEAEAIRRRIDQYLTQLTASYPVERHAPRLLDARDPRIDQATMPLCREPAADYDVAADISYLTAAHVADSL